MAIVKRAATKMLNRLGVDYILAAGSDNRDGACRTTCGFVGHRRAVGQTTTTVRRAGAHEGRGEDVFGHLEASHRVPLAHGADDVGGDDVGAGGDVHRQVVRATGHRAVDGA